MVTKRTPIGRPPRSQITPAAIAAFKRMQKLEVACTCKETESEYWGHEPCKACEMWWQQHSILSGELKLAPWEWPVIARSGEGSAQERYHALEQAAGDA